MRSLLAALATALLLAACTSPLPDGSAPEQPATGASAKRPALSPKARQVLAARGIKPHDAAPLSVSSDCSHVDEIGTATQLKLHVDDGDVRAFLADVAIKGHGRCRFALNEFRQESSAPQVLLRHARDSRCTVRMWREQDDRVTVAFNSCRQSCEGQAFEYLWPILVESESGQCY